MKQYSIGAVAKLTGLTVHNLRVWEKRHSAIETERSDSGRRIYNEAALDRLKLLKSCVDNGFTIGTIAGMSNNELSEILQEFETATAPGNSKPRLSVSLIGEGAIRAFDQLESETFDTSDVEKHNNIEAFTSTYKGDAIDLLFIEKASLTAEETKRLAKFIKQVNAPYTLLMYRYSRQQDVAYLKTLGVKTLKAPLDKSALQELIESLLKAPQGEPLLTPMKQAPARTFSDFALNKAAGMTSSIECECPQHLSELIKSLVDFEAYSAECENKDKASADLHHHIYVRTAQARAILEDLLQSVLDQEGIDLSRVNH